jgi:hypothetical protein
MFKVAMIRPHQNLGGFTFEGNDSSAADLGVTKSNQGLPFTLSFNHLKIIHLHLVLIISSSLQ